MTVLMFRLSVAHEIHSNIWFIWKTHETFHHCVEGTLVEFLNSRGIVAIGKSVWVYHCYFESRRADEPTGSEDLFQELGFSIIAESRAEYHVLDVFNRRDELPNPSWDMLDYSNRPH